MGRARCAAGLAVGALAILAHAPGTGAAAPSANPACNAARASLGARSVDSALAQYTDLLGNHPVPPCAITGLHRAVVLKRREAYFCLQAEVAAKAGMPDEAKARYADASRVNHESECAPVEPPASTKEASSAKAWWQRFWEYLPQFPVDLASLLLMVAIALGVVLLGYSLFFHRASLVVKPFTDGAIKTKVGGAFAGLVEEQLVQSWRSQRGSKGAYSLDLVDVNVEVFSQNDALSDAVGELAQVPQLQLVVAILAAIDRAFRRKRLVATGELLPAGERGLGVGLSLYNRKSLVARGTLWERREPTSSTAVATASPVVPAAAPVAPPTAGSGPASRDGSDADGGNVAPYYALAGRAASWVQYEAALALDSRIAVITSSAESFSLVSVGIWRHREAARAQTEKAYVETKRTYRAALALDRDNVAALVNLALLLQRDARTSPESVELLLSAKSVLSRRYRDRE